MSVNEPGLHLTSRPAEDPKVPQKNASISISQGSDSPPTYSSPTDVERQRKISNAIAEDEQPICPDQFDPKYETTDRELYSYYAYYIGNNGLPLLNFAPTQFQNLMSQAAAKTSDGLLYFIGGRKTVNSIVLEANGISFAIQVVAFLILGSYADFGTWRPNILIGLSLVAYGLGFGWIGVHQPDQWHTAAGLYIVGLIAYQTTLTFWTAAFPGLARNTRELRDKAQQLESREIDREEYDRADMMTRSRISNVSFYIQSLGEIIILALTVGVLFGVHSNRSTADNTYGISVLITFTTACWLVLSIPWFIMEKRRPGLDPGMNIILASLRQLYRAFVKIWRLKQSLCYLIGYFLLGDTLNTTVTVIYTLSYNVVDYNTLTLTYVFIVGIIAQAIGIFFFWTIQKRYQLDTKTMFNIIALGIIVLDCWGLVGIWTQNFGFHKVWEVWGWQVYYGLFVCPWYSYSNIMISEVTPRGYEFLFFSLFSIIGKTSSFIGPFISSAIIDRDPHHNENTPFYFLTALAVASFLFLYFFVDLKKSKIEQARFLEEEAQAKIKLVERIESVSARKDSITGRLGSVALAGNDSKKLQE